MSELTICYACGGRTYEHRTGCPKPRTQVQRLISYLRAMPGATSLEITYTLHIVNVTGRVSDCRAAGVPIDCRKRDDGRDGYWLRDEKPQQMAVGW